MAESSASLPHALPDGNRSYFLHDLLTQFIFREAHLVEPNLQWAWRYRLLRLGGHLLVLVLAFLLWQGMQTSQQTNGDWALAKKLQLEFMNLVKIHEDNICERLCGEEPFLPSDKADRYLPVSFYKH
ncbi:SciS protein, partial [Salmonella enterica subsp. enterica serovar Heidelberg str. 41566]